MENKEKCVSGFREAYEKLGEERGVKLQFRTVVMDKLKCSDRHLYNLIAGKAQMTISEWRAIENELKHFGVDATYSGKYQDKRTIHTQRIENSEYMDMLENSIDAIVIDMWRGETRKVTEQFEDAVFEIEISIIETANGETIVSYLSIEGESTNTKFNCDYLVKRIFKKKY